MMLRPFVLTAVLGTFTSAALPANAAVVCEADLASLDFGQISVRDGISQQTSAPVTISCSGGTPGATALACVMIGPGSGRSGPGQTPRYMTGDGTAPLKYQLTAQNTISGGGSTWDTVGFKIPLDATGSGTIAPTLYAEVISIGAQATIGSYTSRLEAGRDVQLTYGETECSQSGAASSFTVRANVTASCTVSVSDMNFGVIDAAVEAPVDQTATISVSCTNASAYTVGLDYGRQPTDFGPSGRRMANGGNVLAYGLYHDASHTLGWALGAGAVSAGKGTGGNQTLTVFGRIFASQQAMVGIYRDTVVVVVAY